MGRGREVKGGGGGGPTHFPLKPGAPLARAASNVALV